MAAPPPPPPPPPASLTLGARPGLACSEGRLAAQQQRPRPTVPVRPACDAIAVPRVPFAGAPPAHPQPQPRGADVPHSGRAPERRSGPGGARVWAAPLGAAGLALWRLARSAAGRLLAPGGGAEGAPTGLSDSRVFPSLLPSRAGPAPGGRPGAPGGRGPAVVWFRSDLRVADHEPLAAAGAAGTSLVPVYCFDPREYGQDPSGFDRTGPYRAAFVLGALEDLRASLRAAGSELVVRVGRPEEVLTQIAASVGATRVYCHAGATEDERRVDALVSRALDARGVGFKALWGSSTLFSPDDLPFKPSAAPLTYGSFRDRIARANAPVRRPAPAPESIKGLPLGSSIAPGDIPTLGALGFSDAALRRARADTAAAGAGLRGGERHALAQMQEFAAQLRSGAAPRGAPAPDFAARASPWLAVGCLSPRTLWHELKRAGAAAPKAGGGQGGGKGAGGDMSSLLFQLMWRDFFRFVNARLAAEAASKPHAGKDSTATPALQPAGLALAMA